MSSTNWEGKQLNRKQIATIVVANTWAQNDTATITVDGLDFIITIGTLVTTAQVATTIKQALNGETLTDTSASCVPTIAQSGGSAIPQFRDFTATVSSSTVSLTALVTGATGSQTQPFTVSGSETTAGDGTITVTSAATAHKGKHDATDADNWSGGAALADDDAVFFLSGDVGVYDNLAVTCQPASITKSKAYTGRVGRYYINKFNTNPNYHYPEYRTLYFTTDDNTVVTTANLEIGEGQGSGLFMWDAGAGQVLLNIFGQGTRYIDGVPCILFKGSHASNEICNFAGDLGIAWFQGETAVVATLNHGSGASASAAKTICKSGVTLTTVNIAGGEISTDSAISTVNMTNGTWKHGAGTVTTANIDGGVFQPLRNATITTLRIGSGGILDCTKGNDGFTVTNTIQLYKGATIRDPNGRMGNIVVKLNRCTIKDVTLELASDKTYTLS